jgi:hypothetical protein
VLSVFRIFLVTRTDTDLGKKRTMAEHQHIYNGALGFLTIAALVIAVVGVTKAYSITEVPVHDGIDGKMLISHNGKLALSRNAHVNSNLESDPVHLTQALFIDGLKGKGKWLDHFAADDYHHRNIDWLEARQVKLQIKDTFNINQNLINEADSVMTVISSQQMEGPMVTLKGVMWFLTNQTAKPWIQNVPIPALHPAYGSVHFLDGETEAVTTMWCKIVDNDIHFFAEHGDHTEGLVFLVNSDNANTILDVEKHERVRLEFTITYMGHTGEVGVSAI